MTVHRGFGFFHELDRHSKGEGIEFHLLVLAVVAFLMIRGAGAFSVDRVLNVPVRPSLPWRADE